MDKILIISDFCCTTGFATVGQNVAKYLKPKYEIDVLALNYHGDPHPLQKSFNIFPATLQGDMYGINRVANIVASNDYKMIFMINDIWIVSEYIREIRTKVNKTIPIVTYTPVDAPHLKPEFIHPLNQGIQHSIYYTEFGRNEAILGGLTIPSSVISHGVDQDVFQFMPKKAARDESGIPHDDYVVLMVNRNNPRKRLDYGIYAFSEWVKRTNKPKNVKLYYHGALRDVGPDLEDVADYCGVGDRFIITSRNMTMNNMLPIEKLKVVYNSGDVYFSSSSNEGWGLCVHEAMACGLPCIIPQYSALAEWPNGGVEYISVDPKPEFNTAQVNTIFRQFNLESFIEKSEKLYNDAAYRKELGKKAYRLATKSEFEWKNIANEFHAVFQKVIKQNG